MEQRKMNFFNRVKNAIINFDEYRNFSEEKVSVAIKYLLKVILIFTIVITIALSIKFVNETNKAMQIFKDEFPEFKFENNSLIIEQENKKFIRGDELSFFGIIVDSEKDNLSQVEEKDNYQQIIALLKDKIVVKNINNVEAVITYEQINKENDLSNINKQAIIEYTSGNYRIILYLLFVAIAIIWLFIICFIKIIIDVLVLSLMGYIASKIIRVKFDYKSIFNMSVYALTLSILLSLIYIIVNLFTGYQIIYFDIAYDAIAYIYIITAMLMIKSDLIKQQIEVGQIVEEQIKIREEKKQEEKEEQKQDNKDKENKKEKDKKDKDEQEGTPEGSKA